MTVLSGSTFALGTPPSLDAATSRWLLEGPAQLREGPQAGAVVGSVDGMQQALYAYPEITGYFLQWLAWRSTRHDPAATLAPRATAAQDWLRRWLGSEPPPTRIHLREDLADWRNDAVFCFDAAMVLRGLGSAVKARLIKPDAVVVAGLSRQLERLVGNDGLFVACRMHDDGAARAPLPGRWSTRRGGFLAKAAAGIMTAQDALPGLSGRVLQAATATFEASLRWDDDAPHAEVHPLLYTFEGFMSMPRHPCVQRVLPRVAQRYDTLLARMGSRGQMPESLANDAPASSPLRVDVMAQTLRIGQLLAVHRPQQPPDHVALARLRQALARQIAPSGAVPFALAQPVPQWNVWATMFADQALGSAPGRHVRGIATDTDPLLV